jgi:hypothetical protein
VKCPNGTKLFCPARYVIVGVAGVEPHLVVTLSMKAHQTLLVVKAVKKIGLCHVVALLNARRKPPCLNLIAQGEFEP